MVDTWINYPQKSGKIMYKKDLKKLDYRELKKLVTALKRSRDASQNIYDKTEGIIKHNAGRKELKQHLGWYERQLNKAFEVLAAKTPPPTTKRRRFTGR